MRRVEDGNERRAGRRVQRVGEQVVVKVILHVLIAAAEVVPAVFRNPQPGRLLGIAAPSKAVERQRIEDVLVGQRLHGERLLENARAGLVVDQRVIHGLAAADVGDAAAKFNRLRHLKAADFLALSERRGPAEAGGVPREQARGVCPELWANAPLRQQQASRNYSEPEKNKRRDSLEHPLACLSTTGRTPDRSWNHGSACGTWCTPDTWRTGRDSVPQAGPLLRSCSAYGNGGTGS